MNFFEQGIPLGRWFKITVVLHWTFLIYAAFIILPSAQPVASSIFMALLFATVLLHEFGHAISCQLVGGLALHIVLWPLGGIAFVKPPNNPWAWLITTVCGPLVNAILWPLSYLYLQHGLMPTIQHLHLSDTAAQYLYYVAESMYEINRGLLLFNLIPAYPMDGGRILQEILWLTIGYARSLHIAGMVGTVTGIGFVVLGMGVTSIHIPPPIDFTLGGNGVDPLFIIIGILCAQMSFGIYRRSQEIATWRKN
jgi:Zn-dependent protease